MNMRSNFGVVGSSVVAALLLFGVCTGASGVELAILSEENWDDFAPHGKEVDAIYGDYVLRNDKIVAVIARDVEGRNANMTVRNVGGCIIDLTLRENQSDQLSAYYPVMDRRLRLVHAGVLEDAEPDAYELFTADTLAERIAETSLQGSKVWFKYRAEAAEGQPAVEVVYTLSDEDEWILVETTYSNPHDKPIQVQIADGIRVDGEFEMGVADRNRLFWAYDIHWGQAYGVESLTSEIHADEPSLERRRPILRYVHRGRVGNVELEPRDEQGVVLKRRVFPARDSLAVKALAHRSERYAAVQLQVVDPNGPVAEAHLAILEPELYGRGKTDEQGQWSGRIPLGGTKTLRISAQGREPFDVPIDLRDSRSAEVENAMRVELPPPGFIVAKITDGEGRPIPCKVSIHGRNGTPDPDFGPDSAIHGVRNLWYTADGSLRIPIAPGQYDVVVSHGPEYDAAFQQIEVQRGEEARIEAKLARTLDTTGWLSAELHSHSSPSGDNTASQRGRVLNLIAEHLEFIPCTEHNRVDTYIPHLKHLDALDRVVTCSGMELTGQPLPINHQNAFPLVHKPRIQDGGGPVTDADPVVQIERLALWDNGSDKLVQTNHPNIPQMVGDRDYDGTPDEGFERMFGFMDVIEVHPPADIFTPPTALPASDRELGNKIFHWMQLLNVGYRVPGVVNTDAHWNFYGSGWLRNYIKSNTDNPSEADVMDLVHACEHGHVVMTNGPFLEVTATAGPNGEAGNRADVGGDLAARDGYVQLHVRVQCPNWLDVNRVQVFVNGRPSEEHNYRRATHRDLFASGVVKFDETVQVMLDQDAHVIVAAAGEGLQLGRVMGGPHAEDIPVAVTNPIFVDVDGGGFTPNGDMLGVPLRLPEGHTPSHGHEHR